MHLDDVYLFYFLQIVAYVTKILAVTEVEIVIVIAIAIGVIAASPEDKAILPKLRILSLNPKSCGVMPRHHTFSATFAIVIP